MAASTAVAALAAVGLMAIMPASAVRDRPLFLYMFATVVLMVGLVINIRSNVARAKEEGKGESTMDPLTGLATVATGQQVLELEFAAAQRGRPLTIVLIRLENLPNAAGKHGRTVAEHLMRKAGATLQRYRRSMHLTARYGADPTAFITILSGQQREGATVYAKRVRHALRKISGMPRTAAVSVGIACFDLSMESPQQLINQAHFALERGSEAGGKVVVVGG
jgi:diguanylate cyclase (GGDEF)-like protein